MSLRHSHQTTTGFPPNRHTAAGSLITGPWIVLSNVVRRSQLDIVSGAHVIQHCRDPGLEFIVLETLPVFLFPIDGYLLRIP